MALGSLDAPKTFCAWVLATNTKKVLEAFSQAEMASSQAHE
jgi:hypothetical protein